MVSPFDLFVYALMMYGLWYIIGRARISMTLRESIASAEGWREWLVELVECPACFGWWQGLATGIVVGRLCEYGLLAGAGLAFLTACLTVATNLILFALTAAALARLEAETSKPGDPDGSGNVS